MLRKITYLVPVAPRTTGTFYLLDILPARGYITHMNTTTHSLPATLTAGQKAAATRRLRMEQAAAGLGSATSPVQSAGLKAAATRAAKAAAEGHAVRLERLSYAVPGLPGARLERRLEDGEVVWVLFVADSRFGEVVELSGRWAAAIGAQTIGDRFATRQNAVERLVSAAKRTTRPAPKAAKVVRRFGLECPTDAAHGVMYRLSGGEYHCPHAAHTSGRVTKATWTEEELTA